MANSKELILKSLGREQLKSYLVYDGSDRLIEVYEAHIDAANGAPCLKTTYTYRGPTSTQIEKRKEEQSTWSSAYDI